MRPSSPTSEPSLPRSPRWIGPALLAVIGVAMLLWTWGEWLDLLVDFGGELYVAWRLRGGDVLYRDLAYFTGPLSPYVNALWFRLFGTSLLTLVVANLALLALTTALLYRLAEAMADRFAATVACASFLALCALAVHQGAGNYNFVCPYSHEMTHATLLSLAGFTALRSWLERPRLATAAIVGLCSGAVFLTKVEFSLALTCALAAALATSSLPVSVRLRALGVGLATASIPALIAFSALASAMPAREALRGVLGAWVYIGDERVSGFPLYRIAMGLVPFGHHALRIGVWSAAIAAFFALAGAAGRWRGSRAVAAHVGLVAALLAASWLVDWVDAFYPLPLFTAVTAIALWRRRRVDSLAPVRVAFAVFALVLLARIAFNARVQFYGFALAAPAVVSMALASCAWLPHRAERTGAAPGVVRAYALAFFVLVTLGHLVPMQRGLALRTVTVGSGADSFSADPRAEFITAALEQIEKRTTAGDSVLVLPEGAMLNYLARRRAPSRYFNYMPPELAMFGESAMLASLRAQPPELVVLVHRETLEYGLPHFGRDYGRELMTWIKSAYEPVKLWSVVAGQKPLEPGTTFAVAVLQRKR